MKQNDIIFIAKYPTGKRQQDGAAIRFLEIDKIFKQFKRVYIESFSYPLNLLIYTILKEIKHNLLFKKSFKNDIISSHKFINKKRTFKLFENAKLIYIESYGNLIMLPPEIIKKYGYKMAFDCHGCAYEEAIMANLEQWKIDNLMYYEKLAVENIKHFVVVSNNMKNYYINKYSNAKNIDFIVLPIFPSSNIKIQDKQKDSINLIYSGRNYVWQNSELMIKSIAEIVKNKKISSIDYTFLTPDIDYYTTLAQKYGVENDITIKSVAPNDLNQEYAKAHLGFILREDNVVNKVSCPTKLVEYMKSGIIPVVLQPEIGDFNNLGYKYILLSDLVEGNLPSNEQLAEMQKINLKIIENIETNIEETKKYIFELGTSTK